MSSSDSITAFLGRLKEGDEDAAQVMWERYFPRVVRLAGKRLVGQRRQAADEEDVAISVMESFFRAARDGRCPNLSDRDGIWRLLSKMTGRKAVDLIRKNAVRPIVGESALAETAAGGSPMDAQPDDEPPVEVVVMVSDEIQRLMALLPEQYRDVAAKKLECLTVPEIAQQCGVHISTVERKLRIIRTCWGQALQEDGPACEPGAGTAPPK